MTAQASVSAQTIRSTRVERDALPYELKIQEKLAQVHAMVAFVEQEHFTLSTVYAYLQQEKRAVLAVRNIARILGYALDDHINETQGLLSESEGTDLYHFTDAFAPTLFDTIDTIGPNREYISDMRTHVEELQYATETRQALLQYLLISYNARYQRANLFGNLLEASKWTAMYSRNLDTADEVIHRTRGLLVAQKNAVRDYLNFITQEIREIYDLAEARYRVVKPIAYMQAIEAAENRIIHILGERSQAYETLNLAALTPQQRKSRFSGLAKHVIRRAPKLAIFLMGLAAAGTSMFAFLRPHTATASASAVPDPVRGTADNGDTARFTALNTGDLRTRSAQILQDIAANFTGSQTTTVAAPAPTTIEAQKIGAFFTALPTTTGKQTLVLENATEFRAFMNYLQSHNYYSEGEVLSLFNVSSVEQVTHRLVVDVRHNALKPMLFPYNEGNSNLTAPMTALPASANTIGSGLVSLVTAAFSDVNSNTAPMATLQPNEAFIVYRVQSGDTLDTIATRYGTTTAQIQSDNILGTAAVAKGQMLQIRRPAATTDTKTAPFSINLWGSSGTKLRAVTGVIPKIATISSEVVSRYYTQLFPSLDAMPTDARTYVVNTVNEVANFFNVRPQDVLGILKQEQNNAGFRLYDDRVSSAGAVGIAQIVPQTWNGWSGGSSSSFSASMEEIERDGGIGFDWTARETWRMVQNGGLPASALANTNADPNVFENAIAGVARHLSDYGVTSDLAAQSPTQFEQKLADAIAIYNSGRPLSESSDFVQSAENHSTTGAYVAQAMEVSNDVAGAFQQIATTTTSTSVTPTAALEQRYNTQFRHLFDSDFGIQLSDAELAGFLAANQTLLDDVRMGKVDPMVAGNQLIEQVEMHYMREGRDAIRTADVRPWPYIHNAETLEAQRLSVSLVGRTLTLNEMDQLVVSTNAEPNAMRTMLAGRPESRIFVQAQQSFDQMLQRSSRGLNLYHYEIAAVVQPLLSGMNVATLDDAALRTMTGQIQAAIRALPEYQDLYGSRQFKALPYSSMPEVFKGFGVPVSYQAGGYHTGIDVAAPSENGEEPAIYAVDSGTVVHVGSLYCAQPDACRGGKAVVIDHGNNLYTLYSHNSESDVQVGQQVSAGQQIGRQGNEGYSFGSHLHFEVHTGAAWSGDWEKPFEGGSFVDPMEYLPKQ